MKTEAYKLYSRVFWIFLPNVIKIDLYDFELYRFKVGAFLRHSVECEKNFSQHLSVDAMLTKQLVKNTEINMMQLRASHTALGLSPEGPSPCPNSEK